MHSVNPSEWRWFGTAAHFICGAWCRFHLATQVGDYLISTVGEYVHPRHGNGSERAEIEWLLANWPGEDIGCDRKYETMVFKAGDVCNRPECKCGLPQTNGQDIEFRGYNERGAAAEGHMELCRKYAGMSE